MRDQHGRMGDIYLGRILCAGLPGPGSMGLLVLACNFPRDISAVTISLLPNLYAFFTQLCLHLLTGLLVIVSLLAFIMMSLLVFVIMSFLAFIMVPLLAFVMVSLLAFVIVSLLAFTCILSLLHSSLFFFCLF